MLQISDETSNNNVLVFFKLKPETITLDNLRNNVMILSMPDALSGLYHSLKKVRLTSYLATIP